TDADFDGWIKERGLYFAQEWDENYTPLFSVTDAQWPDTWDELPFLGSMLTTDLGKGRYTYTSLVLHTQIENNVPGAYRLYATLLTPPASAGDGACAGRPAIACSRPPAPRCGGPAVSFPSVPRAPRLRRRVGA